MNHSLAVNVLWITWRKTELNIDKPHPYGHRPMPEIKLPNCILKRPHIAQAEGCHWKSEMDNFLMILIVTNILLLPARTVVLKTHQNQTTHLQEFSIQDELWDHDIEGKEKGKVCADCQRNACEGEIQEGDKVLLRPEKENKLSSRYTNSKANGI